MTCVKCGYDVTEGTTCSHCGTYASGSLASTTRIASPPPWNPAGQTPQAPQAPQGPPSWNQPSDQPPQAPPGSASWNQAGQTQQVPQGPPSWNQAAGQPPQAPQGPPSWNQPGGQPPQAPQGPPQWNQPGGPAGYPPQAPQGPPQWNQPSGPQGAPPGPPQWNQPSGPQGTPSGPPQWNQPGAPPSWNQAGGPAGQPRAASSGFKFDARRWTRSDKIAGGASLLVLISLFLPWFSGHIAADNGLGVAASSASESGTSAHGWLWLVFVLGLAIVAYLVLVAGFQVLPFKAPLPYEQVLLVVTSLNFLLVLIAFLLKPSTGGISGVSIGWSIGAFLALVAALAAVAVLTPPGRAKLDTQGPAAPPVDQYR